MEYLSSEKIIVIDLATSQVDEFELEDDLVADRIGGAGITKHLYDEHADGDPVVIGTGLLTGSMYPASAASVVTAKSPVTGKLCHFPVTFKAGIEIKYAGFDYIVIKGAAAKPTYLWVHDSVADLMDADAIWGQDVWAATDALREEVGDDLLQTMLIGPAGENGSDFAQLCINHWSSADRFGIGKLLGQKNFKGFAFRGMGLLEADEPEDFVERAFEILDEIKDGAWVGKKGIGEICAALGETEIAGWIEPLVHRHSADYFTPYASNTFLFLDEDPARIEESPVAEPGILVADIPALIGLKKAGCSAVDAGRILKACAKYGIDPAAVAELSQKNGKSAAADIEASLATLSGETTIGGQGTFSPWCPLQPIFGDFDAADLPAWWERRQAVAGIFGIQPIFAIMCPEITEADLLELANLGTGLDLDADTLDEVIADLSA